MIVLAALGQSPFPLSAQSGLFVEHKGTDHLVRKVEGMTMMFLQDGKWTAARRSSPAKFRQTKEFLPFVVTVRNFRAISHAQTVEFSDRSTDMLGTEFTVSAELETPYLLENVFIVLEIPTIRGIFLVQRGVGTLQPGQTRSVRFTAPPVHSLGAEHCVVHLFSDGSELLHTNMPEAYRDEQLDRIVANRIAGVRDADVQALVGPSPAYPTALLGRSRAVAGEAVVRLRVTRQGAAREVELVSATVPEFGPPAIEAARAWRFLPPVSNGVPQETMVELPFRFDPPARKTR